jgi:hypothetical protein
MIAVSFGVMKLNRQGLAHHNHQLNAINLHSMHHSLRHPLMWVLSYKVCIFLFISEMFQYILKIFGFETQHMVLIKNI